MKLVTLIVYVILVNRLVFSVAGGVIAPTSRVDLQQLTPQKPAKQYWHSVPEINKLTQRQTQSEQILTILVPQLRTKTPKYI